MTSSHEPEATPDGVLGDRDPPATVGGVSMAYTQQLCRLAVQSIPVDGAAVTVRGGVSTRELLYASDPIAARLDDLQFVIGEGPCRDAFRERHPIIEDDLTADGAAERWPGFSREAVALGAGAVFAFPLQVGAVPFGVLATYRRRPGALTDRESTIAVLLADSATRSVMKDVAGADLAPTPANPDPVFGHGEVPLATGMIAAQRHIPVGQALAELRAAAFADNRPVVDFARDVLARRITFRL